MARIDEVFASLHHQPIHKLLQACGLDVKPTARSKLSDWSWDAPSGSVYSLWIADTVEEDGKLRQRFNVQTWARERAGEYPDRESGPRV